MQGGTAGTVSLYKYVPIVALVKLSPLTKVPVVLAGKIDVQETGDPPVTRLENERISEGSPLFAGGVALHTLTMDLFNDAVGCISTLPEI